MDPLLLIKPPVTQMRNLQNQTPPRSDRTWGRVIGDLYANQCLISGISEDSVPMERHHLWAKSTHPKLKWNVFNGVLLCKELHRDFHNKYGPSADPADFIRYLDYLEAHGLEALSPRLKDVRAWVEILQRESFKTLES